MSAFPLSRRVSIFRLGTWLGAVAILAVLLTANTALARPAATVPTFVAAWGSTADAQLRFPAGMAVDSAGNVYVADTASNRIQKYTNTGVPVIRWGSLASGPGELNAPGSVAVDGSGNIYVADTANYRVIKFQLATPCPALTTQVIAGVCLVAEWGSSGVSAGQFNSPFGLTVDGSGNVYVVDSGNHRVQKFSTDGTFQRMWGWGVSDGTNALQTCTAPGPCLMGLLGSGAGQFYWPRGIGVDSSGNIHVADTQNNRIQKFDNTGTFLIQWGAIGSGEGNFRSPQQVTGDSLGNVFVADKLNHRIQKFSSDGTFQLMWGWGVSDGANAFQTCTFPGPCLQGLIGSGDGQFNEPIGVTVDSSANVYVSDSINNRIQKFNSSYGFVAKWGSPGNGEFYTPQDVATDAAGNVYVADMHNHRIQKFTQGGTYVTQWGGWGAGDGKFNLPVSVASDGSGNVYVVDQANSRIQKFSDTGSPLLKWGSLGAGSGDFRSPKGIAVDSSGNVYVSDEERHDIQKFTFAGSCPVGTTLVVAGVCVYPAWGGYGIGNGEFHSPGGLAVDTANNVYVADTNNSRIQKLTSAGVYITQWGVSGAGDGEFDSPQDVAVSPSGDVFVADTYHFRIQQFSSSGDFIDKWGSWGTGNGLFNWPVGLAFGSNGNIYVADNDNQRIQVFQFSSAFPTPTPTPSLYLPLLKK